MVWAGGIRTRPFTQRLADAINSLDPMSKPQNNRRGLVVDNHLAVVGAGGAVFSLGDCAASGCAPTAQAAFQQGAYLGKLFTNQVIKCWDKETHSHPQSDWPAFQYVDRGALAYVGSSKGVAELKPFLWNKYPLLSGGLDSSPTSAVIPAALHLEGGNAFAIWRSLYFTKLMSQKNRVHVSFDWLKTSMFGRDISSLYVIPTDTDRATLKKSDAV